MHRFLSGKPGGCVCVCCDIYTTRAYKIPETAVSEARKIEDLNGSGVYVLLGEPKDRPEIEAIYIGQAATQPVLNRILQRHNQIKWHTAIAFVRMGNPLGATEVNYLEHCFYHLAKDAARLHVTNSMNPAKGFPTLSTKSALDVFVEQACFLLHSMGLHFFTPIVTEPPDEEENPIFVLRHAGQIIARGQRTEGGFAVLRGSRIIPSAQASCPPSVLEARRRSKALLQHGVTTADILFPSPSTAYSFVTGGKQSGLKAWRRESDGLSLSAFTRNQHRPTFDFFAMGIPEGETITFVDSGITATVATNRKVSYQGRLDFLQPITREILGKTHFPGTPLSYWTWHGRNLQDLYEQAYPKQQS